MIRLRINGARPGSAVRPVPTSERPQGANDPVDEECARMTAKVESSESLAGSEPLRFESSGTRPGLPDIDAARAVDLGDRAPPWRFNRSGARPGLPTAIRTGLRVSGTKPPEVA